MERLRDFPAAGSRGNGRGLKRVQTKLFVEERQAQSAITHFQSILKGKPTDLDALFGLALAHKKMGRIDLAIGELERARQMSPRDGGVLRELGICYFLNGRLDDASSVLGESLVIDPNDILSLYYMGRTFQEKGDLEGSLKSYLRAKEINPNLVDLYYSLAMVYGKRGDRCNSHRNFGTYFDKRGAVKNALFHFKKAVQHCDEEEGIQQEIRRLERALKEESKEM
jgi:tetratricopeptide (TPR) repeat protein